MEDDYYEIVSELDAREILRYLNHLGIHNISGEVLKYFITDLKKLIKYDLQQRYNKKEEESERPGPERLHSASTFCSRLRSKVHTEENVECRRDCERFRRPLSLRNTHSAPAIGRQKVAELDKSVRRACSCNTIEKKSDTVVRETKRTSSTGFSNNIIKVQKPQVMKKSDPVSLYHYYTSLWAKYKPNVPGENNWADLRWQIRQKMAGYSSTQSEHKIQDHPLKGKENAHMKK